MLIDWFTVAAQMFNFLILVWLLKRFLYQPILRAIDEREQRLASIQAEAQAIKAAAETERGQFRHNNEAFNQQRAELMALATQEATAERQRLLDAARQAADDLSAKRQAMLIMEAHNLKQAISSRTRQEVFAIARKVLTDMAATDLEAAMTGVFIQRLRAMDGQTQAVFANALKKTSDPVSVRSVFALPDTQRTALQQTINELFAADIAIRFETAPDLISGIELVTHGQKIAWTIADYLSSMEQSVSE
ncbi:MAG: F0F1 ATP synthase subunit B, partial [Methylovulum sp.]|nr:F0F1 ATP synthase subunit B [Methylovulum sp.]